MQLLVGATLSPQDVNAITEGQEMLEKAVEPKMLNGLASFDNDFVRDHVRALAWMVANRRLTIKVIIPTNDKGQALDEATIEKKGIFHQKVGIIEDGSGNVISFSGSINETAAAWMSNIEEFKVFRKWITGQELLLETDTTKFEKYWQGKARRALVLDVPEAVRRRFIDLAPADIDELELDRYYAQQRTSEPSSRRQLKRHQVSAVEKWEQNDFKGILAMATGTGKTLVALRAIEKDVPVNALGIVAVPTDILVRQWKEEIRREFPTARLLICGSSNTNWRSHLETLVEYVASSSEGDRRVFVVTTYNTGASNSFQSSIGKLPPDRLCLCADEVHHAGAVYFSNILSSDYKFRLGLSATPDRDWDEVGQAKIVEFFGGTIYNYEIQDALRDDLLSQYEYHVYPAYLASDELESFHEISRQISRRIAIIVNKNPRLRGMQFNQFLAELARVDPDQFALIQALVFRRVNILKKSRSKRDVLRALVRAERLGRCLVYCNDTVHLNEVIDTFHSERISPLRYDSSMSKDDKQRNLEAFSNGTGDFLVAIKCLDEGVDIPTCDSAILMANSKSTREFIQRRGRLLRKDPSKTLSRIFDILVLPVDPRSTSRGISRTEYQIVESELKRARLFAQSALNAKDVLLQLTRIESELASLISG